MQNSFSVSPTSISPIRGLDSKSTSISSIGGVAEAQEGQHTSSFSDTLANAMGTVNDTMQGATDATNSLLNGSAESLHAVQIAGAKSEIMMKLTTTITSKLAQATTQLFQMQV